MKADNQALRLERLMQKHQVHPEYELCLPSVSVKKSLLKKLSKGDVLLLGMEQMEMLLLSEGQACAKAVLFSYTESLSIEITETIKQTVNTVDTIDSKKYKEVSIFLGSLRSRTLESRHKLEITEIDLDDISLYVEKKKIAVARLVMVDDEIAVEIKEVKKA